MVEQLPDLVDSARLAHKQATVRGALPLARMTRLQDSIIAMPEAAEVELNFTVLNGAPVISGRVTATVQLECQNCLEPLAWPIDSPINLGVVDSLEAADRLPEPYEPLLLDHDTRIRLADVVEEELLLALPIIARHPQCEHEGSAA